MVKKQLSADYPTLVVFCKRPKLNQGKQRLVEAISTENALLIAEGLLACAIEDTKFWQGPVVIACSDKSDVQWAQALNAKAEVITQLPLISANSSTDTLTNNSTGNLGERLNYVDSELRALGHKKIVIIGTDAPILNIVHYQAAVTALNEHDVVLSHADDGGVIIMANSTPWPNISLLPWSTEHLSQALAKICSDEGLSVHYSTPGYDIDYITDIEKLKVDLIDDHRPARQALLVIINKLFISSGTTNYA